MASKPRVRKKPTSAPTTAVIVPRRSTSTHAPPTNSTTPITSPPSTNPRGTATSAANGPTGCALHGVIAAGDGDTPAGGRIVTPVEFACREAST